MKKTDEKRVFCNNSLNRLWQEKEKQNDDFNNILHNSSSLFLLSFEMSTAKIEMFLNKCHSAYWRIYDTETMPCHAIIADLQLC